MINLGEFFVPWWQKKLFHDQPVNKFIAKTHLHKNL